MEKSKNSINMEGGFSFCGGGNFSKSVSVFPTFIREMRVLIYEPGQSKLSLTLIQFLRFDFS